MIKDQYTKHNFLGWNIKIITIPFICTVILAVAKYFNKYWHSDSPVRYFPHFVDEGETCRVQVTGGSQQAHRRATRLNMKPLTSG